MSGDGGMKSGYDIGFADSNAAATSAGFSFFGGGKNSATSIAVIVGVAVAAAGVVVWIISRFKRTN